MPYDVEVQINLTVKGWPTAKSTIKPKNITDANSKIITFINDGKTCPIAVLRLNKDGTPKETENRKLLCRTFLLASACDVAFVAIKTQKNYKFKQCPSGEVSGVGFYLSNEKFSSENFAASGVTEQSAEGCPDSSKIIWIESEYIAVDFCASKCAKDASGKEIAPEQWITIFVDPAMFECSPNPAATFEVTVTYGLVGQDAATIEPQPCCTTSSQSIPAGIARNSNGRQVVMS